MSLYKITLQILKTTEYICLYSARELQTFIPMVLFISNETRYNAECLFQYKNNNVTTTLVPFASETRYKSLLKQVIKILVPKSDASNVRVGTVRCKNTKLILCRAKIWKFSLEILYTYFCFPLLFYAGLYQFSSRVGGASFLCLTKRCTGLNFMNNILCHFFLSEFAAQRLIYKDRFTKKMVFIKKKYSS